MNLTPHHDVIDIDTDIDIDAIARAMTLEDPPAAMRTRVLAQLPPRHTAWGLRLALPLGSVTALMLAWLLVDPTGSVPPPDPGVRQAVAQIDNQPQPPASANLAEPLAPTVRRVTSPTAMSEEEFAWHSRAVAPLPAFAPIELPAIQPTPLSIAPISVDPIVPDSSPLRVPDAPNGGRQ